MTRTRRVLYDRLLTHVIRALQTGDGSASLNLLKQPRQQFAGFHVAESQVADVVNARLAKIDDDDPAATILNGRRQMPAGVTRQDDPTTMIRFARSAHWNAA